MAHPSRPDAKPVAEFIAKTLDPLARKRGLARAELIAWWPEIVGAAYAAHTAPERIRWARDGRAATLVVRCDPSVSLQFAHETARVRERLNAYFGYPAVGRVRIVQQPVGASRRPEPRTKTEPPAVELTAKLDGIDGPLKESLQMLGRRILAGS